MSHPPERKLPGSNNPNAVRRPPPRPSSTPPAAPIQTQDRPDQPKRWWLSVNGETEGPHNQAYIAACLKSGKLNPATLACPEGSEEWQCLYDWHPFAALVGHEPTQPPMPDFAPPRPAVSVTPSVRSRKSLKYPWWPWVVSGVCGFLFLLCLAGIAGVEEEAEPLAIELAQIQAAGMVFALQARVVHLENQLSELHYAYVGGTFFAGIFFLATLAFVGIGIWKHVDFNKKNH